MKIAFALFADGANISQEGKLNILGVFDAVQVGSLPALHPRAFLVARIVGRREDAGTHPLTLAWRNPEGAVLWDTAGELHVEPPPQGVEQMDLPFIAALDLPLDKAGTYTLAMQVGQYEVASVALQVRAAGSAPGPMIPGGPLVS